LAGSYSIWMRYPAREAFVRIAQSLSLTHSLTHSLIPSLLPRPPSPFLSTCLSPSFPDSLTPFLPPCILLPPTHPRTTSPCPCRGGGGPLPAARTSPSALDDRSIHVAAWPGRPSSSRRRSLRLPGRSGLSAAAAAATTTVVAVEMREWACDGGGEGGWGGWGSGSEASHDCWHVQRKLEKFRCFMKSRNSKRHLWESQQGREYPREYRRSRERCGRERCGTH
jgi:hypothetical protein